MIGDFSYTLAITDNNELALIVMDYRPPVADTVAPTVSNIRANITAPTNTNVVVTAEFADDVELAASLYRIGETGEWTVYPGGGIILSENATVYFKAVDAAGNESAIASFAVSNIDKVAPVKPMASADVTTATNGNVFVFATFSDDSAVKEYSLDGQTWKNYAESIKFTENGTVYFRSTDEAGNVSEVTSFEVTNIDKVAPEAPTASADITTITNGSVLVSAQFSEDSAVKEYSLDGQTWQAYTTAILFTANGSVYFRATDAAGNVSEVASYAVTNIESVIPDTTSPTVFNIAADIIAPTNQDVVVTAEFADDVALASTLYRIGETGEWTAYTDGVTVTDNATVFFKAVDASGNESEVVSYEVNNIDKVAPVKPTASADITTATNGNVLVSAQFSEDSAVKEYSLDGENWIAYTEPVKFTDNGSVFFRATDEAGMETIQTTKLTLAKGASLVETTTKVLSGLDVGDYYISMTAKNTKATDKGSVFYNVSAKLDVANASALEMSSVASLASGLSEQDDKLAMQNGNLLA